MSARLRLGAVAAGAWLTVPDRVLAQGCAMCRTALAGQDDPLVAAINTSIIFMMVMPYLIVGSVGGWIYLASRRRHDATPTPTGGAPDSVEGDTQ